MLHPLWLAGSLVLLVSGVVCILFPQAMRSLADALDRSVASFSASMLEQRRTRYITGILLMTASVVLFKLAYMVPLIGK